jgi:hypothetical protein
MSPSASMNAIARRPLEQREERVGARVLARAPCERVLDDREPRPVLEQLAAQVVDLRHRQTAVVGDDQRVGRLSRSVSSATTRALSSFCISPPYETSPHSGGLAGGVALPGGRLGWTSVPQDCHLSLATGV